VVKKAVLQVTDIANNRNKYYAIELHEANGKYRVFKDDYHEEDYHPPYMQIGDTAVLLSIVRVEYSVDTKTRKKVVHIIFGKLNLIGDVESNLIII
jgi:hypothetical protein